MTNSFDKKNEPIQGPGGLPADIAKGMVSAVSRDQQLQLTELLTKSADQLAKEDKELRQQRKKEEVLLHGGKILNLGDLIANATDLRQPYEAIFPNSIPFFREIFRLMGLDEADANKYNKPGIIGKYLVMLIYMRFSQGETLVTYLRAKAIPDGIRTAKFFQYLNPAGVERAKLFRDEAIDMMKQFDSNEWYLFYKTFGKRYGIPIQLNVFEEPAA